MSKQFDYIGFANAQLADYNQKYRPRSDRENTIRNFINSYGTVGESIDLGFNGYESLNRINYNNAYRTNPMNYTDNFERSYDAFKRTTDIDYSSGGGCNIF